MSAFTTAYLWTMAAVWFAFLVVGFRDEHRMTGVIVAGRALLVAWPLACLVVEAS